MNHPDVTTRVRGANPVPNAEDLPSGAWSSAELLHVIDERRRAMRELMNDPVMEQVKQRPPRWRVPILAAVAAFVLVTGAIGIAAFVRGAEGPTGDAATNPSPAEDVATTVAPTTSAPTTTVVPPPSTELTEAQQAFVERYIAAFNSGSWDAYYGLFADGTQFPRHFDGNITVVNDLATEREIYEFRAALDARQEVVRCAHYEPRIVCTIAAQSANETAFGRPPWITTVTMELDPDGLIASWSADMRQYDVAGFEAFDQWLQETHPDIRDDVSADIEWRWDSDPAVALQLLEEYRAHLEAE